MSRNRIFLALGFACAAGPGLAAVSTPTVFLPTTQLVEHRTYSQLPADLIERDLNLSRAQRRAIQNSLNYLGFNAGIADGIFGSRTRAAIAAWQRSWGAAGTGYLNARQLRRLEQQVEAERDRRDRETRAQDDRFWQATGASGRLADLRRYLARYPDGIHAAEARRMIRRIETGDESQEDRRDHAYWRETGADGTEAGLRRYLRVYPNGLHAEEARQALRRIERQDTRRDNAFWRETGADGSEEGLRRYLRQYPNGVHAEEARRALRRIEEERDRADWERRDREAWRTARARDTIRAYQSYLSQFPRGRFVAEARARIAAILNRPLVGEELAEARRIEAAYLEGQMPGRARQIEQLLRKLGYVPGPADGVFDAQTRAAIRQLQLKLGRRPTGFIDPALGTVLQPER